MSRPSEALRSGAMSWPEDKPATSPEALANRIMDRLSGREWAVESGPTEGNGWPDQPSSH